MACHPTIHAHSANPIQIATALNTELGRIVRTVRAATEHPGGTAILRRSRAGGTALPVANSTKGL